MISVRSFHARWARQFVFLVAVVFAACFAAPASAADDTSGEVLKLVIELLRSSDRDTRGLALQQVREDLAGEPTTRRLAELLPTLPPESQAALLEALADRGDPAARAAVRNATASPHEAVRVAAMSALGRLGQAEDVAGLARAAAASSGAEKEAARRALARLPGDGVNDAIIQALEAGSPAVRVELLPVLSRRAITNALPAILKFARAPEPEVRRAALKAAQTLAGAREAEPLIQLVQAASSDVDRDTAEAALLAVSQREPGACLGPVLTALPKSAPETQVCLLHVLAAISGPRALQAMVAAAQNGSGPVQREALRLISEWSDPAAIEPLLHMAETTRVPLDRTLALRGLIRLAAGGDEAPVSVDVFDRIWRLTANTEEKRLFLGAVATVARPDPGLVSLAARGLEDAAVRNEAVLAVVTLAGKLKAADLADVRSVLGRALAQCSDPQQRERLEALEREAARP